MCTRVNTSTAGGADLPRGTGGHKVHESSVVPTTTLGGVIHRARAEV